MGNVTYLICVRDNVETTGGGQRKTGLTLSWVQFKRASDGTNITPQPTFAEIGNGQYKFTYDPQVNGEAFGQIDAGSSLLLASDRYIDVQCLLDSSRLVYSLPSETPGLDGGLAIADESGQVAAKITEYATEMEPETRLLVTPENKLAVDTQGRVSLNLTQTIPTSNTAQTVGDALNALTLYAADGTTVVRTFTLNDASAPTTRT
jgi:hypothetical protein